MQRRSLRPNHLANPTELGITISTAEMRTALYALDAHATACFGAFFGNTVDGVKGGII